jgi:hypothetical protein
MKTLYTSLLVFAFLLPASAELPVPFKKKPQQEFQTRVPADVAKTLRDGSPEQRNNLALELGIMAPNPSSDKVKSNSPCVDFTHVEEKPVTLRAGAENELLLADSSACDSLYVVVFDKAPKSEWRHVQTVRLAARTQRPEITFSELIQPGVSEILVHREVTSETGDASQQDFVVLKLLHDRVEAVLDTTEHSELTLTNRSPDNQDNLQQTQTSTFNLLKAAPNSAAQYRLLEKEVITDNKTTITRDRVWTWDPGLERFRSAPFDAGAARPVPPPAKKPAAAPAKPAPKQP